MDSNTPSVSIRVVARFRPINGRERRKQKEMGWTDYDVNPFAILGEGTAIQVLADPEKGRKESKLFQVDRALWNVSQSVVFEAVALPVVQDTLRGINGTIFAYGQAGSGKTFTMFGPELSPQDLACEESLNYMGLFPRSTLFLFKQLAQLTSIKRYELKVSALEICPGNVLRDLLHPRTKRLKCRDGQKGVFIQGLKPESVSNTAEVLQLLEIAMSHRTVSATKMNATSSRSHSVITLIVNTETTDGTKKQAKLNFVDLAPKQVKTGATGQRRKEEAALNSSLTVLGRVISALAKKERAPFRESSLTYVLKDSLVGNTKTTFLACLSPHVLNVMETIDTLKFATRAKLIKTKVQANKVLSKKDMQKEITRLNKENATLQRQLREKATPATSTDAPENALSISMQRQLIQDLDAETKEKKRLEKELKAVRETIAKLEKHIATSQIYAQCVQNCHDREQKPQQ